jgi:hypothetical protein
MKQRQFSVLCVILLVIWATDAKAQNQDQRIKELEERIEQLQGDRDRDRGEYNKKLAELAEKLNAFESVYALAKVPVGTILPFYGDPSKLTANWKLCDEQEVTDSGSPFFNQYLPDLRERFPRGAKNNEDFGKAGGNDWVSSHSHKIEGLIGIKEGINKINWQTTEAGGHDMKPEFLSVYFIIRIR